MQRRILTLVALVPLTSAGVLELVGDASHIQFGTEAKLTASCTGQAPSVAFFWPRHLAAGSVLRAYLRYVPTDCIDLPMSAPCVGEHEGYPALFSCTFAGPDGQWTSTPPVRAQSEGVSSGRQRVYVECEAPPTHVIANISGALSVDGASVQNISITHDGSLLPFEGVTDGERVTIEVASPPSFPPPIPPPSPPPGTLLARAAGNLGTGAGAWAATWAEVMAGKGQSGSWASNASEWGWAGLSTWPTSGLIEMRCWNVNGGGEQVTFSETFTLDKGSCESSSYSAGCATFDFVWESGCYRVNGQGYDLSTSDLDRDGWIEGHCASGAPGRGWPTESGGWGWHTSCGCGGLYKYNGQPMCMGSGGNSGAGYVTNGADRVEMWLVE